VVDTAYEHHDGEGISHSCERHFAEFSDEEGVDDIVSGDSDGTGKHGEGSLEHQSADGVISISTFIHLSSPTEKRVQKKTGTGKKNQPPECRSLVKNDKKRLF
jgi:hypothetical protein